MNVKDLVSVSVKDGTVVFTPKGNNTSFYVIGCSCTLAKKSSATFDKSFIVVRPQSNVRVTVIGIAIGYKIGDYLSTIYSFIGIYLNEGNLYVDLDNHYIFKGGTISSGDKFLAVLTLDDGRKFAHYTEFLQRGMDTPEGFQLVDNVDLLFQFAAGVIDLATLESYATADKRTAQCVEIGKLKQRISLLETELEEKTLTIADLQQESKRERAVTDGLENRVSDLLKSVDGLRQTLDETYKRRDEYANTVIELKRENNEFVTLILDIEASVFRALMPYLLPWRTVSVCRKIVCRYADIVSK